MRQGATLEPEPYLSLGVSGSGSLAEFDAFILGRVTYEMFASRWSGIRGDPYYDAINVFERSLIVAPPLDDVANPLRSRIQLAMASRETA